MSNDNPSQSEVNKMVRVLTAAHPLKYTVRIHKLDGNILEYQANEGPKLDYNNEARGLWINSGAYPASPVCEYSPGMVILVEENPKP